MVKDSPSQSRATGDGDSSNTTQPAKARSNTHDFLNLPKHKSQGIKKKSSDRILSTQLSLRAKANSSSSKNESLPPSLQNGIEQSVEDDMYRFRLQRLEESNQRIFIAPMAKSNPQARDDTLFSLMDKVDEFLTSNREVMLILGDSGAGKSTFNRHLEHQLWANYSVGDPIPVYINLPTIQEPEEDMVAKQLQMYDFEDEQIQEMKQNREFVLICDGYDESQLTTNLYTTNRLNQHGQWRAKLIISCRTQLLGPSYLDQFVPQGNDRYQYPILGLFQEAVIAPFSNKQVEDYVTCYVPLEPRPWVVDDYMHMLTTIPNLMDLVRNPFLLTLALETLPDITKGKQDLSTIKISRVQLYDAFVTHWLGVNKRRLESNTLSPRERAVFDQLLDAGFVSMGLDYSTRLASAIFNWQNGAPLVHYVHLEDQSTWKANFFESQPEIRLLRESSPLIRTGDMFRFIHRSMLEYFFSRCIYKPTSIEEFDMQAETEVPASQHLDADGPLFQRDLLKEPSVIQFLCDRVRLDLNFEHQLRAVIHQSKTDTTAATAATNAITILVRADMSFMGADLRGAIIPGADLSNGQFDSAQFQGADLSKANLARTWLRQANFSSASLEGVTFGELPYIEWDDLVLACCFSPNGMMLATGICDGIIFVYETSTWTKIHCLEGHVDAVKCIVFSPDSQRLISSSNDNTIRLWNTASGEELLVLEGHDEYVFSVAISPCGNRIASASDDKTVRVWNAQTGECLLVLEGHSYYVRNVKFSPDGRQIVSGGWDETIRFWDSETGEPGNILNPSYGQVRGLAYSPDGRWIAAGYRKGHLQLWDAATLEPGAILSGHTNAITGIDFSPNGQWIASCSQDRTVLLWDASTGSLVSTMTGHTDEAHGVAFSPDSLCIASVGDDYRVRLWQVNSSWSGAERQDRIRSFLHLKYTVDGQDILSSGEDTVQQWCSRTGVPGSVLLKLPQSTEIFSMALSPDGRQIAAGDHYGYMQLWDFQDGAAGADLPGHVGWIHTTVYSPCGRWIVSCTNDGAVHLWDLYDLDQGHDQIAPIGESIEDRASRAVFSPTSHHIAIGYVSGTIRLFDPHTRGLLITKELVDDDVLSLAYSPSGLQLAIGTFSGPIFLWDLHSEKPSIELEGHSEKSHSITYSPCGQWIASGGNDRTVLLWHQRQDVADESWSCVATVQGFFDAIHTVAWNPVVPLEFASACWDGSLRVWRISSDSGKVVVNMLWGSNIRMLCAADMIIKDAIGLDSTQKQLLLQRGATDGATDGGLEMEE